MSDVQGTALGRDDPTPPQVETFTAFFRREYSDLVALSWALTGSRDAAEDIVQDAMTAVYLRWEDLGAISDPRAYLRRICANKAASGFRRRAAELRALFRLSSQPAPSDQLPETSAGFWAVVRSLPRRQAQTIALHYGCDMSVADIAASLDMAPGTVKVHLSRGRAALSERLLSQEHQEGVIL